MNKDQARETYEASRYPGVSGTSGPQRHACTCPCDGDETPHNGKRCDVHGCHLCGNGNCEDTPKHLRCSDCPVANDKIRTLLQSIVDAHDAGCIQFSSQEIQFDDEHPPHPWHEEWLADVRRTLSTFTPAK